MNSGMYWITGASSSTLPWSTSLMVATVAMTLLTEAMPYMVVGPGRVCVPRSA